MSHRFTGLERSPRGSSTRGGLRPQSSPPHRAGGAQGALLVASLLALGAITLGPGAGALPSQTAAPRAVWVGTEYGLYRSTDAGEHWLPVNGLTRGAEIRLGVNPSAPQVVYAGFFAPGSFARNSGLYKTTDGGNSWRRLPFAWEGGLLTIDPTRPQVVYANRFGGSRRGGVLGLFRSRDGGEHWQKLGTRFCEPRYRRQPICRRTFSGEQLVINPRNPRVMYTRTPYATFRYFDVWKSTDGGRTWIPPVSKACFRRFCGPLRVSSLAMDPQHPSVLYAAAGLVYKTTDAGRTWVKVKKLGAATTIAVDPKHSKVVYAIASAGAPKWAVYKSTDGGRTWTEKLRRTWYSNEEVLTLAVDPDSPDTVYVGTALGVFKTSDGGATWAGKNQGFPYCSPTRCTDAVWIHALAVG